MSTSRAVVNTFTFGDINIELTEAGPDKYAARTIVGAEDAAKIIPGLDIEKDPKITVKAKSEACWLFVEVKEENWPAFQNADGTKKISYSVKEGDDGWKKLTGVTGADNVYYREVSADDAQKGAEYYVLEGNGTYPNGVVTVSDTLTKDDIKDIASTHPTLTFTAYAVQREGIDSAADAWQKVDTAANPYVSPLRAGRRTIIHQIKGVSKFETT